jgi:hypothetical protein
MAQRFDPILVFSQNVWHYTNGLWFDLANRKILPPLCFAPLPQQGELCPPCYTCCLTVWRGVRSA